MRVVLVVVAILAVGCTVTIRDNTMTVVIERAPPEAPPMDAIQSP
jgi:hypothetical protein